MPLTDIQCKNADPKDKAYKLYDQKGLYLEVSRAGGKYWRFKYRFLGKEKRLALGVYPKVSLSQARVSRDASRQLLDQGVDPSANRRARKSAAIEAADNSFVVLAMEWFERNQTTWTPNHATRIKRRLDARLFGASLHGTADMERPHSQLRTRLADRLRRNDADRFANVDTRTAGEVATVARGADPFLGLTSEDRTDTH